MEEPAPQEPLSPPIEGIAQEAPRSNWRIWLAAGGCALVLCATVFVGTLIVLGPKYVEKIFPDKISIADVVPPMTARSNTMGEPDAPVHIIVYGDYQCPYCRQFWQETESQLIEEYVNTGKVYFEYRTVGAFLGPESGLAAQGSYCAGDQGRFWEYHNILFNNWSGENVGDFTQDKLIKYASALELDMTLFEACINEETHKVTVEQDAAQAAADGVNGTPTVFINGVIYEGVQPYHALKYLIDQALNGNLNEQSG